MSRVTSTSLQLLFVGAILVLVIDCNAAGGTFTFNVNNAIVEDAKATCARVDQLPSEIRPLKQKMDELERMAANIKNSITQTVGLVNKEAQEERIAKAQRLAAKHKHVQELKDKENARIIEEKKLTTNQKIAETQARTQKEIQEERTRTEKARENAARAQTEELSKQSSIRQKEHDENQKIHFRHQETYDKQKREADLAFEQQKLAIEKQRSELETKRQAEIQAKSAAATRLTELAQAATDPAGYENATRIEAAAKMGLLEKQLQNQKDIKEREFQNNVDMINARLSGVTKLLANKKAMAGAAGATSLAILSWYAWPKIVDTVHAHYMKPVIVDETTRFTLSWGSLKKLLIRTSKKRMPKQILNAALDQRMNELKHMIINTKKNRGIFQHILLKGKPGTGKTMWARQLAYRAGMDFALVSGPALMQVLSGGIAQAIQELRNLFAWARTNKKGTVIFIDEVDVFLEDRFTTVYKEMIALVNEFLAQTGTENADFVVIMATNRPEILDPAVDSRIGESVYFPLPTHIEISMMIEEYLRFYITQDPMLLKNKLEIDLYLLTPERIATIAQTLEQAAFSGRDIMNFVMALRSKILAQDPVELTEPLLERVIQERLDKKREENKKYDLTHGITHAALAA